MTSIGTIVLSGEVTLNHSYNYNNPSAHPFSTFSGPLTVVSRDGIFAAHVSIDEEMVMETPDLPVSEPKDWTIGGFTLELQRTIIAGADSGRAVVSPFILSGHSFNPGDYPSVPLQETQFTAPAFHVNNFPTDVTGTITMTVTVAY